MINVILFLLALAGFGISGYIFYSKKKNKKMVCSFGGDCETVVNSKYNNVFGVPLEIGGMLYYFVVMVLTVLFIAGIVGFNSVSIPFVLISLGAVGVIFSIYLVYVQGVILKDWCQYCLASAAISLLIFIVEILP